MLILVNMSHRNRGFTDEQIFDRLQQLDEDDETDYDLDDVEVDEVDPDDGIEVVEEAFFEYQVNSYLSFFSVFRI